MQHGVPTKKPPTASNQHHSASVAAHRSHLSRKTFLQQNLYFPGSEAHVQAQIFHNSPTLCCKSSAPREAASRWKSASPNKLIIETRTNGTIKAKGKKKKPLHFKRFIIQLLQNLSQSLIYQKRLLKRFFLTSGNASAASTHTCGTSFKQSIFA